jgi:hypothetical protein
MGRAMAQAVRGWPLTADARFVPWSVHVGILVDKVAMGLISPRVLQFFPVTIIPPWLFILIHHTGDEQYARWWLQFKDVVSPHRHEQQRPRFNLHRPLVTAHT